ncbi:geranylgeranyl diphosphate synthase type I [Nocardia transvalensis]|uniref:Geranylgeranyl diphosphate synthase type I n=1 Tax=Nocardia transvalensis TaxID=37333 RepID=A0A7W9UM63_9NOCA|nr:polyprenyl synthetase family protein [Nocardia transvalensis]MBB5917445.1 geranylgeranyl diphosphate synthase type I [Nocardia transvalensis]
MTALPVLRRRIDAVLEGFLRDKARAADAARLPPDYVDALHAFVFAGGKRARPLLCALGWLAAGGSERMPAPVFRAAAALEMHHAAVLIHDAILTDAPAQRGAPPLHRAMAQRYSDRTRADVFGRRAAGLLGTLALSWSDELLGTAHLTARQRAAATPVITSMRDDVVYGQFLELLARGPAREDLGEAMRIVHYRSASHTCERPLELGATLAGADPAMRAALTGYARPLGEAVQLAADLRAIFGAGTGTRGCPPQDLRGGRSTALVSLALERADARRRRELLALVGDPGLDRAGADRCRELFVETGARAEVEEMVSERLGAALRALDRARMPGFAVTALGVLARRMTCRVLADEDAGP